MITFDFKGAMTKDSLAFFYELLAGGLLEGRTVDVTPLRTVDVTPLIAVPSASVGVTDDLLMIHSCSLILLMIYL